MGAVSSLFKEDTIFLLDEDKKYTETEILRMIGNKLIERKYVKTSFIEALLEREEKYPTGLRMEPYAVAIPHTDPGHVKEPCISIVRLKTSVTFHEMVNTSSTVDVNFIFCIALPGGEKQTDVLQHLMGITGNREVMESLKNAQNAETVYKIISEN